MIDGVSVAFPYLNCCVVIDNELEVHFDVTQVPVPVDEEGIVEEQAVLTVPVATFVQALYEVTAPLLL